MAWSLLTARVRTVLVAAEAQRNEPGINQVDNCGPACVSCLMQIHGYADIEPQDLVGPYYRGGTTGPQLSAIVAKRYPNPPPMPFLASGDPVGDLARWAAQRFLSLGLFWSDGAAVVKPYNTGIGHWCIPVADDDTAITFWNSEWGQFNRFLHKDFLLASWHQFVVCQRAVPLDTVVSPQEEDLMYLFRSSEKGTDGNPLVYVIEAGHKRHLGGSEYGLYVKAGVKIVDATAAELAPIPDVAGSSQVATVTGTLTIG